MRDTSNWRFRVFCAYGPLYREPGCGWETEAESEAQAERLIEMHEKGQTHIADYELATPTTESDTEGGK